MQKALLAVVGLVLMLGTVGCEYAYSPMTAKEITEHPLKPLPTDYRAQIWLKLAPTYSHTDDHFSRWDFYMPQGWKEGYIVDKRPVGGYTYDWRCDVNVTFVREKRKDEQKRYTFVYKDGQFVQDDMTGELPAERVSPTSALPYAPYNIVLNQLAALSAHLPDKDWSVDNQPLAGVSPTKGMRAFYFQHAGQGGYDSAVYVVDKLTVWNGWQYADDAKSPMPIGESPLYYVYAYKGPGVWPTFDKDVMSALFTSSATDPGLNVGPRNAGQ